MSGEKIKKALLMSLIYGLIQISSTAIKKSETEHESKTKVIKEETLSWEIYKYKIYSQLNEMLVIVKIADGLYSVTTYTFKDDTVNVKIKTKKDMKWVSF